MGVLDFVVYYNNKLDLVCKSMDLTKRLVQRENVLGERSGRAGLTLLELLIVVSIILVLTLLILGAVSISRRKAHDASIRNAIKQIRWQAEIAYNGNGGSYLNWVSDPSISQQLYILIDEIDAQYGDSTPNSGDYMTDPAGYVTALRYTQEKDYCISAPVRSSSTYLCLDAAGDTREVGSHCPDDPDGDGDPILKCPSS